ncbi:TPA: hypothetical protein IAB95_04680, partial [Candidatus Ventrenecus avicola]|nr:hypothetical protein [Candidatus Ventrenecus avicola]
MRRNAMYIVFASAIMILICIIYQGTYSYFLASAENNGNDTTTGGTTEELTDLIITDGVDVTSSNIIPGESVTSTFTVQNQNDIEVCFGLVWTNVTNTFTNTSDLIVTLQKSDGTVLISDTANQIFPTANDEELISGLKISGETTDTYTITITYKNTDQNQIADMNATFSGTITGTMTECPRSITDEIIANVDTTGACPPVDDDGTVNVTSAESTNGYLCSAPDDYGTSYYYRGNVDNNYVKFAGFYWRILRINGDGSIRMIYAGDADVIDALDNKAEVLANGYNDGDTDYTQIGTSRYNSSWNDNAGVGYMYGTTGASTYEETHANTTNSTIKGVVDEWYRVNIEEAGYSSYINDTLFCNDRSFASNNTGTGAGTSKTYYRWYYRPWDGIGTQYPRLTCAQQNDRFTVEDTQMGNGALTYPVGLLTIDEVYLAGGSDWRDSGYYLYTGNNYWTMSPSYFYGSYAYMRYVHASGNAGYNISMIYSYGVRPVLNLKSGSLT